MPAVKALDRISTKWARVASASQAEYEDGVRNPRKSWADETAKANDAYEKGVQAGIAKKRFVAGVKKAGNTKWQQNAIEKGPRRWAEGVNLAQGAYEDGFSPYRAVIEGINLPARGPKGDPRNIERVKLIAEALHAKKLQLTGG